jgi:hypothetical protein
VCRRSDRNRIMCRLHARTYKFSAYQHRHLDDNLSRLRGVRLRFTPWMHPAGSSTTSSRAAMSRANDRSGTEAGGDDEDEDGDFQDDRHLQALKRKRWQPPGAPEPPSSEPLRSAAAGPRAHATTMDDLPLEVYPLIIAHLPVHAAARLALVSTVWNAALAQGLISADFHTSLQSEYAACRGSKRTMADAVAGHLQAHAVADDALRLLGAVTCRLDGPASTIELVRRMAPVMVARDSEELFIHLNGFDGFAEALNKCRRASEWSAEKVFECIDILGLMQIFTHTASTDSISTLDTDGISTLNLEEAHFLACDVRSFAGAFGSVDDEAVLKLCLDKMLVRTDRSKVIMLWFACFSDEYDFTEDDAARIGLFVASAALPIADVVDLIDHLREQEDGAEAEDWIGTRGCLCTVATLRAWARAASFPTQWPTQARTSLFVALSRWSATNAADVAFEGRVAKLAMSWAMELLAPHVLVLEETGVTDGPVLDATRLLQIVSA